MSADGPVLDTLTDMTAASVEHNSLTPREFMMARLAAMIAVDAPPISYYVSASAFEESGLTTEDIQGVMIAVAPVTGAPRVMSAGGHIMRALGIAVAVAESEMADLNQ
jgi:alkylhydroperoxidase/carboxymuconolactone decarboxylase family protein YurZ